MNEILTYLIPVFAIAVLTAGWMGVQLLAKKMNTKNHIDHSSSCCGTCDNKDSCELKKATNVEIG